MDMSKKTFAFNLAAKDTGNNSQDASQKEAKWQARSDVSIAGCTYVRKLDDYTFGRTGGDGSIFC